MFLHGGIFLLYSVLALLFVGSGGVSGSEFWGLPLFF